MQNDKLKKKFPMLLSCPFCGGEPMIYQTTTITHYGVTCSCGQAGTLQYHTEAEAIKAWNTRKPMERIVEQLEETSKFALYEVNEPKTYAGVEMALEIVRKGGVNNAE